VNVIGTPCAGGIETYAATSKAGAASASSDAVIVICEATVTYVGIATYAGIVTCAEILTFVVTATGSGLKGEEVVQKSEEALISKTEGRLNARQKGARLRRAIMDA